MHIGTRLGAAGLAAALLLPTGLWRPDRIRPKPARRIWTRCTRPCRSTTPDLYANTPQEAFEAKKAEIEGRLAEESDVDFALDLQSLVASSATPTPPPISAPF